MLTGHHRNYSSIMAKAREIVRSGVLGSIVAVTGTALFHKPDEYFEVGEGWRRQPGGGPILLNLIDDVNNLQALVGDVVRVQAVTSNATRGFPVEDTAAIILTFADGALGTFLLSDAAASARSWEQTSQENNVEYSTYPDEDSLPRRGDGGLAVGPDDAREGLPRSAVVVRAVRDLPPSRWSAPIPSPGQVDHFAAVIRDRVTPICSGRDGLKTLQVVDAGARVRPHRPPGTTPDPRARGSAAPAASTAHEVTSPPGPAGRGRRRRSCAAATSTPRATSSSEMTSTPMTAGATPWPRSAPTRPAASPCPCPGGSRWPSDSARNGSIGSASTSQSWTATILSAGTPSRSPGRHPGPGPVPDVDDQAGVRRPALAQDLPRRPEIGDPAVRHELQRDGEIVARALAQGGERLGHDVEGQLLEQTGVDVAHAEGVGHVEHRPLLLPLCRVAVGGGPPPGDVLHLEDPDAVAPGDLQHVPVAESGPARFHELLLARRPMPS